MVDTAAVEILSRINYDFSVITANINEITQLAWIARSIHTDRIVRQFSTQHPRSTIVNFGCGLDTTFERVDNGKLYWYDLDLPDVIRLRKNFITESARKKFISRSLLDEIWFPQVRKTDPILFLASGVFYYFYEDQNNRI